MSIYESATKLANDIKDSKEYIAFQSALQELRKDKESEDLLKNYRFMQMQMKSYEANDRNLYNKTKKSYEAIHKKAMRNKKISKYIENEQKFAMLMSKINKILADSVVNDYR